MGVVARTDRQVLRRACAAGSGQLVDIAVENGAVSSVSPATLTATPVEHEVDAAGHAVIAGLVDLHVHLDKAYLMPQSEASHASTGAGLDAAIAATKQLRTRMGIAALLPGMRRLLTAMRSDGTAAARAHVEIDIDVDPGIVTLHRELAQAFPEIVLQLCAFPQNGLTHDASMVGRIERALDDGCQVVGGCPYADADPVRHVELLAALARDRGLPLDLHLDLTDEWAAAQLDLVLPIIERYGLQGRVTLGHLTALSALPPDALRERARRLVELQVTAVVLPTTDLWLSGRGTSRPGVRGVAPVAALVAAGVPVALGSNNHQNAFTPVSGGGLLRIAWLASLVCQIGDADGQLRLLDAVSAVPAQALGLGQWDVTAGSVAPLLVLDCDTVVDAVREAPSVLTRFPAAAAADPPMSQ